MASRVPGSLSCDEQDMAVGVTPAKTSCSTGAEGLQSRESVMKFKTGAAIWDGWIHKNKRSLREVSNMVLGI